MKPEPITRELLRRLHGLWRQSAVEPGDRNARLEWATRNTGREISSFSDLTKVEANSLAEVLRRDLDGVWE